jgi:hypothetical protein
LDETEPDELLQDFQKRGSFADMNDSDESQSGSSASLVRALAAWLERGRVAPVERWLIRTLDDECVPNELELSHWPACLSALVKARKERPGWPRDLDDRLLGFVRVFLRFSRPTGVIATVPTSVQERRAARRLLSSIAEIHPRSAEGRVIGWWLSRPAAKHVPPPLPAWSSSRHPLSVLRADWEKQGDMLVVDHRRRENGTQIELLGGGVSWLGPAWRSSVAGGETSRPKVETYESSSAADHCEWSLRLGGHRITRTAVLLRGQRLALLGEQVDYRSRPSEPLAMSIDLAPGIMSESIPRSRALKLRASVGKSNTQAIPIALPSLPYETDRGRFETSAEGSRLTLQVAPRGNKCWLPLVLSWDGRRQRKNLQWRVLTVTEDAKVCGPDVAFAARVSWGRDETLVIYRSLARPGLRAFLGHQTRARFLVGRFTSEGIVEPLVTVE